MITIDYPPKQKKLINPEAHNWTGYIQIKGVQVFVSPTKPDYKVPVIELHGIPLNHQARNIPRFDLPNDARVLTDFIVAIVKEANFSDADRFHLLDQINALP